MFQFLRIILWLLPAFIVPILAFSLSFGMSRFGIGDEGVPILIGTLVLSVIGIGLIDQLLRSHQKKVGFWKRDQEMIPWFLSFFIAQIILVPTLLYLAVAIFIGW